MKLRSIETTPSPNCMKLNLDSQASAQPLTLSLTTNDGKPTTGTPKVFQNLLDIEGVQSVFVMGDFVTLTRRGSADWQPILTAASTLLGVAEGADSSVNDGLQSKATESTSASTQKFAQVEVAIQKFRGIPVQVRATNDAQQARVALPDRFNQALQRAIAATDANYVAERIWAPYQPQFGDVDAIAHQIAEELDTLIDDTELVALELAAIRPVASKNREINLEQKAIASNQSATELLNKLQHPDWKQRLKAIQRIEIGEKTFSAIVTALKDSRVAIRRWATALLGASERDDAVQPLCQMLLTDASPIVRRTAGDALSDLGNPRAGKAMIAALADASALVRWRAARYLNEMGDATAVEPLKQAIESESEFDVRVEMTAAVDRIQTGEASQLPMWMRISNAS